MRGDQPQLPVMIAGLGQLGLPIAVALAHAHFAVAGFDIDAEQRRAAAQRGLTVIDTASDAFWRRATVLVSVLPSDESTLSLADRVIPLLPAGAIHLCVGTISVSLARTLADHHGQSGQHFAACPVFGRPDEAWARDLTALFGPGDEQTSVWYSAGLDVLSAFAPRRHQVPTPEAACAIKLAGNLMIASAITTLTEASRFVQAHGASAASLQQVVTGKLFRGPVYEGVGARVAQTADRGTASEGPAGFTVKLGLKDLDLLALAAVEAGTPIPLGEQVRAALGRASGNGFEHCDWADLPACLPKG
ncbi:MAG: NAD(P)-dependent oxidoreductase [Betaproteobacteria bacterium]